MVDIVRAQYLENIGGVILTGRLTKSVEECFSQRLVCRIHIKDQNIDARATEQSIAAVLSLELVRIVSAPQFVVTTATIEFVFARTTEQLVSGALRIRIVVLRVARARRVVTY